MAGLAWKAKLRDKSKIKMRVSKNLCTMDLTPFLPTSSRAGGSESVSHIVEQFITGCPEKRWTPGLGLPRNHTRDPEKSAWQWMYNHAAEAAKDNGAMPITQYPARVHTHYLRLNK